MRIISIGEILWDVYEDKELLGGAPFNFSVHSKRLGHDVYFVSSVGKDKRGDLALKRVSDYQLSTKLISRVNNYPTGIVRISKDSDGEPTYIIHHPAAYDYASLTNNQFKDILSFQPDWLYFGSINQMGTAVRNLTKRLFSLLPKTKCFYDMNLRNGHYSLGLIKELLKASTVLKLNIYETRICCELFGKKSMKLEDYCKWIVDAFMLEGVCITMGSKGCITYFGEEFVKSPAYQVKEVDLIGAGDAFAAGFLHGIYNNWELNKTCDFANRLGACNVKKDGAIPEWTIEELLSLKINN